MTIVRTRVSLRNTEPTIIQPDCNKWKMSWNPDDNRWYVQHPKTGETMAHYNCRKNAIQWAKKHQI